MPTREQMVRAGLVQEVERLRHALTNAKGAT